MSRLREYATVIKKSEEIETLQWLWDQPHVNVAGSTAIVEELSQRFDVSVPRLTHNRRNPERGLYEHLFFGHLYLAPTSNVEVVVHEFAHHLSTEKFGEYVYHRLEYVWKLDEAAIAAKEILAPRPLSG